MGVIGRIVDNLWISRRGNLGYLDPYFDHGYLDLYIQLVDSNCQYGVMMFTLLIVFVNFNCSSCLNSFTYRRKKKLRNCVRSSLLFTVVGSWRECGENAKLYSPSMVYGSIVSPSMVSLCIVSLHHHLAKHLVKCSLLHQFRVSTLELLSRDTFSR